MSNGQVSPSSSVSASPSASPLPSKERPGGITILSILYGLYAALFLLGGLALLVFGSLIAAASWRHFLVPAIFAGFGIIFGSLMVLIGLIVLLITWGLWNLKEWAWFIAVVFAVLGLLHFPIGTLINLFILWYLFKPEVKAAFKQG